MAAFASRVVSFRDGKVVSDVTQESRSASAELERLQRDVETAA
jgi:hypothetical protein